MELSGTVPLSVSTSTALGVGSTRTLLTLLTTIGLTGWLWPFTVALTPIVYWPAAAVAPAGVAVCHFGGLSFLPHFCYKEHWDVFGRVAGAVCCDPRPVLVTY